MRPLPRDRSLEIRPVRNGLGIVALRRFIRGQPVCRLRGRVVTAARVWSYWDTDARRAANCIRFGDDHYLDPYGDVGAYANHSCDPNSVLCKERGALVVRALRVIRPGDEVTHDYSTFLGVDDVWTMRCNCGSRRCRGRVRDVRSIPAAQFRRYSWADGIPAFVLSGIPGHDRPARDKNRHG